MNQDHLPSGLTATGSQVWACCSDQLFDGEQAQPGFAVIVHNSVIAAVVNDGKVHRPRQSPMRR